MRRRRPRRRKAQQETAPKTTREALPVRLAAALLVAVAVVHYGLGPASTLLADPDAAHRALFYIGQGVKGCLLWACIAALVPRRAISAPVFAVCAWGFFEDAQVAICRAASGIDSIPSPGLWRGICDDLTGVPLYMVGLSIGLVVAAILEHGSKTNERNDRPCEPK